MLKRISGVVVLVGLCALSAFFVSCGSSSSRPSGLLYVLSQEASSVSSYAVDLGTGNLSLINSKASTCAGTDACGLPLSISLDATGATALVLNQGSISGYKVNSDGSLSTPASQATFNSGETAIAMASSNAGDRLFVITDAPALYSYTTSTGSTALTLESSVALTRVPTSISTISYTPSGGTAQTVLFVTSNLDLKQPPDDNTLSVYSVDSSGVVTEAPNSPYTTQVNPTVVRVVNTSGAGQNASSIFAYVGNSGVSAGGVTPFQLCAQQDSDCSVDDVANHRLLPAGTTTSVGQTPVAMLIDPTNSFLYVACRGSNQVFAFSMGSSSGKLTALNPANQPTGAVPVALAMHGGLKSTTEYLYSANNGSNSITGWSVVATTGSLGNPITVTFAAGQPSGMAGR
jgi:6-phosphogluconolactonase (cycloisomerase 2 family)